MSIPLLETFQVLASFQPPRRSLKEAPWQDYVDWATSQGLAPLAAYNLEYRLGGGDAPDWARDRLLSLHQAWVNDNVMKLVNFKRSIDEWEGGKLVSIGDVSFAEALYPHVAFRPVLEMKVLVSKSDEVGLKAHLAKSQFKPIPTPDATVSLLSDGRSQIALTTALFEGRRQPLTEEFQARALPMKVYGPQMHRLDLEDAALLLCFEQAQQGYQVPILSFVDLRELLLGAPSMGGAYSRPCDLEALKSRAARWKMDRALYASASIVQRLFPECGEIVQALLPQLKATSRRLIENAIVEPVSKLGTQRELKGTARVRKWLAG